MKTTEEFARDVLQKRDEKLLSRRRRRKRALLCLPLAAVVLVAGIFVGPRLFSGRSAQGPGGGPIRTLQVGRPAPVERVNPWESVDPAFVKALNDFARDSALSLSKDFRENDCCCPLSLYYALALAGVGSNGETREEFLDVLGAQDLTWLTEQCKLFYRNFYLDDPEYAVRTMANSLWMDGRCDFKEDYLSTATDDLFSSLFQADFTSRETGKEMTKWISENTNGLLEPEFKYDVDYNDLTMLALINTVYLNAQWYDEFLEEFNEKGDFTKADGSKTEVEYMCQTDEFASAYLGDGFTRASRALRGGGEMIFILPDEGVTPEQLLSDPEKFEEMFYPKDSEDMTYCELSWRVPKFTIDSKFDLIDSLRELGLTKATTRNQADFSGMTDDAPLYLARAQQGVHAAIDEKGVEVAAYTVLALEAGAAEPEDQPRIEMHLDRPFLFAITADSEYFPTAILFVGVCGDPKAE